MSSSQPEKTMKNAQLDTEQNKLETTFAFQTAVEDCLAGEGGMWAVYDRCAASTMFDRADKKRCNWFSFSSHPSNWIRRLLAHSTGT